VGQVRERDGVRPGKGFGHRIANHLAEPLLVGTVGGDIGEPRRRDHHRARKSVDAPEDRLAVAHDACRLVHRAERNFPVRRARADAPLEREQHCRGLCRFRHRACYLAGRGGNTATPTMPGSSPALLPSMRASISSCWLTPSTLEFSLLTRAGYVRPDSLIRNSNG